MSAQRLREAATKLREAAEAATPGPWRSGKSGDIDAGQFDTVIGRGPVECMAYCYGGSSTIEGDRLDEDRAYIALMAPPVALALADLLEEVAAWREEGLGLIPEGNVGDAWLEVEKLAKQAAATILGPVA